MAGTKPRHCLKLRDNGGIAANEPRHPDVFLGKPWPEEAG